MPSNCAVQALDVACSIAALNLCRAHPMSRCVYNVVIVYLLTELHSGEFMCRCDRTRTGAQVKEGAQCYYFLRRGSMHCDHSQDDLQAPAAVLLSSTCRSTSGCVVAGCSQPRLPAPHFPPALRPAHTPPNARLRDALDASGCRALRHLGRQQDALAAPPAGHRGFPEAVHIP